MLKMKLQVSEAQNQKIMAEQAAKDKVAELRVKKANTEKIAAKFEAEEGKRREEEDKKRAEEWEQLNTGMCE